jgi:hypothetical protein
MGWLDRVLGKRTAEALAGPVTAIAGIELPLGLRLGGAVALDAMLFKAAGAHLGFAAPEGHQLIEAYGRVDLGAGAMLHRFYLSDDAFLQVNTTSQVIDGIKYFVFHETRKPDNQRAFEAWVEPGSLLGAQVAEVNGRRYLREWGESPESRWAPPVVFEEQVYRGRPPKLDDTLTHYAMLYQREIEVLGRSESLLISAEDYGPNEFCVVYSLGIDVTTADLDIT